ncbi:AraC family transcriptional regulator [Amantichitinum ursilacus]|nr:AraC family transcriptional regulator [Amantichitinum ursilacus]
MGRHLPQDGTCSTAVPGLSLVRASSPTLPMPVVYEPTLCLIAQGRKRVLFGDQAFIYDASRYLVASVGVPLVGTVIEASAEQPYLCVVIDLNMTRLSELALRFAHPPAQNSPEAAVAFGATPPELLDAVTRLAALLDQPNDIEALAPLIESEILYRLLMAPGHSAIRQMATADSRLRQIGKAISWLRAHYREPCRIEQMADIAGMSRSTFHLHFKAVTGISPLEFRGHLRLQEARRLMVAQALNAAEAGFAVGYESASQFSRDYVQLFGAPPAQDAQRMRDAPAGLMRTAVALAPAVPGI